MSMLSPQKEFSMAVRSAVFVRYVAFFEENLGPLSAVEKERLRKGLALAFLAEEVFAKVEEGFLSGAEVGAVAEKLYLGSSLRKAVKAIWGFKKKYEMASMMSSARYAASPESEAYWAS